MSDNYVLPQRAGQWDLTNRGPSEATRISLSTEVSVIRSAPSPRSLPLAD